MDPKTGHSDDPTQTAFNVAFNTKDNFWTWVSKPGNEYRNTRFIMAMDGFSRLDRKETILQGEKVYSKPSSPLPNFGTGLSWGELPDGAKVVDVGGNVGSVSMVVAKQHPKLKFVVQDLPHVITHTEPVSFALTHLLRFSRVTI